MGNFIVTFKPDEKRISVPAGTNILDAATASGISINSSCGGEGVCGRCKIIVTKGKVASEPSGRLTKEEIEKGYVLACRSTIHENIEVEIPLSSRLVKEQILTEESKTTRLAGIFSSAHEIEKGVEIKEREIFTHSPLSTKMYLKLPPPTLQDNISDLERLYREIRRKNNIPILQTGLANVKMMGRLFRGSNWKVTATLGKRNGTTEIVLIEPGDTSDKNFGIAIDIGTTTIVAQLVDLNTRKILGTKAAHNQQATHGDDVIARIIYAEKSEGLEKLHHLVIDIINELISALIEEHKINLSEVTATICAGNMTMVHLLLKVDPTYLRREPYVPTANFMPVIRASESGIKVNPRGLLACIPGISSYVGADIVAGVLATGIDEAEKNSVLIDIGTNGEIVLGNKEWLICCSSSAGPAFEGSGVRCGVRAMEGAIQKVEINPPSPCAYSPRRVQGQDYEIKYSTIGNAKPIGICGSGYIDLMAELVKAKIIDRSGKIMEDLKIPEIREGPDGLEFIVVKSKESATGENIVITQADITNLVLSKGAIYTATNVLAKKTNLKLSGIDKIYLAGGFGNYLNIEKSIQIGLLPDLPREKFEYVGNTSLTGARFSLLSYEAMMKAREIARKITYIELSVDPSFMNEYTGSLFLPHTDIDLFPTVVQK